MKNSDNTPVNPSFTIKKWDTRGYNLYGRVSRFPHTSVAFPRPPITIPSYISILLGRQHPPFFPTMPWASTEIHKRARMKARPYIVSEKNNEMLLNNN